MNTVPHDKENSAFRDWITQELKPRALERQVRKRVFDQATAGIEFLPDVLDRQANQKEFSLAIWDYLEIAASDERARNGRQMLRRHRDLFNRIEKAFGVEPEIVTAIWGLETGYGVVRGEVPTLSALATLAWRGARARYFEEELIAAFRLIQTRGCAPVALRGSWAGAIGHGQFMPSSVIDFAVDFDRDGIPDICGDDPTDALASIANYLQKHAWKKGQPWGLELRLPDGFDYALTGLDQIMPSRDLARMGVVAADGEPVPDYGPGSILLPAGARGVALFVLRNFHVITSYNKSEAYAIAIGHLSHRIVGGRPFHGTWPQQDRVLTRDDIGEAQYLLTRAGFDTLGIDGLRGPNTLRAARNWQIAQRRLPDGYINEEMLAQLRRKERGQGADA
ncbi:lytic murein transglycosylase [Sinisalibacter aestuarii]|uniref:Murein transglycosylase n=1 Tax=Sinisalibacter aestuarii TaxID=2949426 RepID=A0ABQ5LMK8_9RHOB|nr:lytic murein transglycosylase [Sinisalibacter aestuarii]GKY86249.1 murein transglycosylase [Sinisalibacter aestuarii]